MFTKLNEKREGFTLIELLIVVAIIGILAAIAIPQYARYRKNAQNSAAESAYHAVALAEEAFYTKHNAYSTDYKTLVSDAGLSRDPNVLYGQISTTFSRNSDGFYFQVRHVAGGTTVYRYQSNSDPIVSTTENDSTFTGSTSF